MKKTASLFLMISLFLMACSSQKELVVPYSNAAITYSGRIDTTSAKAAGLYWSGTSIKLNFEGKSIEALLQDETGDNYYNVIIDQDKLHLLRPDTTKQYYTLASNLSKGKHTVEIFKRTEWDRGKSLFSGFKIISKMKVLPKSPPKKRKLNFTETL